MLSKYIKLVTITASLVLMGLSAQAKASYGMGGCGLGALVFEDEPGMIQLVAVTLNNFGSQTSAITTGSSNCSDSPDQMAALFIMINNVALQKEISQGGGESLNTLSSIYNCSDSKTVTSVLKSQYSDIYGQDLLSPDKASEKIRAVLKSNKSVVASCKVLS